MWVKVGPVQVWVQEKQWVVQKDLLGHPLCAPYSSISSNLSTPLGTGMDNHVKGKGMRILDPYLLLLEGTKQATSDTGSEGEDSGEPL